jgi:hypothetical protein
VTVEAWNDTLHLMAQHEVAMESPPVYQIVTYLLPHIYEKQTFIRIFATVRYDWKLTQCGNIYTDLRYCEI